MTRPFISFLAFALCAAACGGQTSGDLTTAASDQTSTTSIETSTTESSATTAAGVGSTPVVNPFWSPYDPDAVSGEFSSITALGEVAAPADPQDELATAVYAANAGDTSRPLGQGCSPGDGELGDGIWAVGITGASADHVSIDLVCLYPQQDDMFTAPDGSTCDGPFDSADPCMTNGSDLVREVPLSASFDIVIARLLEPSDEPGPDATLAPATLADFLTYLELGTATPFLVEVRDGSVVRIEQVRNIWVPAL